MFYIIEGKNHIPVPLSAIKLEGNHFYGEKAGDNDEIKKMISNCYQEVQRKFFNVGESVIFKTPGIKSGIGKGNQGYSIPRLFDVKTSRGPKRMAWVDTISDGSGLDAGRIIYDPFTFDIYPKDKTLTLGESDIEKIIFMMLFNPHLITPKNPIGRTYLEDKEEEALKYEATEAENAIIHYWLFTQGVGFYADDSRVTTLCHAWGIPNIEKWSLARKKQLLAENVKVAERKHDLQYGRQALNDACKKLSDGSDIKDVEILSLIQRCVDRKVIKYYEAPDFAWKMLAKDGKALKKIITVPPQQTNMSRAVLKDYLLRSPEDVDQLYSSISDPDTEPSKFDVVELKNPLPDEITEDWIKDDADYNDLKKIYRYFGGTEITASRETIVPFVVSKIVMEGAQVPWKLKEKK